MKKKAAIVSIFLPVRSPLLCDKKVSASGQLESYYTKKILNDNGYDVDFIGYKSARKKIVDNYLNVFDCDDVNVYDKILIQGSSPVFFGGGPNPNFLPMLEFLTPYKGKFYYMASDPLIPFTNPAESLLDLKRLKRWDNKIDEWKIHPYRKNSPEYYKDVYNKWESHIEKCVYVFPGKNIQKFYPNSKINEVINVDWFKYIWKHEIKIKDTTSKKQWDVMYYGRNRKKFREDQVKKYMPEGMNNLLVSYKTNNVKTDFIKTLPNNELRETLNKSKVSLILGDKEHLDNVVTYRFYEILASDALAAISIEYDPNRELIQNPILKKLLYVYNKYDVEKLINKYDKSLIDLQKEELKRHFKHNKIIL